MSPGQIAVLCVLVAVVGALLNERLRADVVALAGAAVLALLGVVGPEDLQRGLASPALIALGSLFVLARALEVTGVIGVLIGAAVRLAERFGKGAAPLILLVCGGLSAFISNTPVVVLAAPLVRDLAIHQGWSPKRLLLPLSYVAVLGGLCTLIGTSTNLLVDDMARKANLAGFGLFEISGVGLTMAAAGAAYLAIFGRWVLPSDDPGQAGEPPKSPPLRPLPAFVSLVLFAAVLGGAFAGAPLAAMAFSAAVLIVLTGILKPEEAYAGLRPEILLMIAGMLVIGGAVDKSGLAIQGTEALARFAGSADPVIVLAAVYLVTLVLTEIMSNAAVAVLVTPLAIGLAINLGVDPRAFVVAVMMAASAAFATPFGYQTNTIVYALGRYSYIDFLRAGAPLNIVTWLAAVWAIPKFFPLTP